MSEGNRFDEMYKIARDLAGALVNNVFSVVGVGLIGSLARGEKPNDIDLVIFTTNKPLLDSMLEEAEESGGGLYAGESEHSWDQVLRDLGASEVFIEWVRALLGERQLHFVLMPPTPEDSYLDRFAAVSEDENFLRNIAADFQRYHSEKDGFVPEQAPWESYLDSSNQLPPFVLYRPHFGPTQVRSSRGVRRGLILYMFNKVCLNDGNLLF